MFSLDIVMSKDPKLIRFLDKPGEISTARR